SGASDSNRRMVIDPENATPAESVPVTSNRTLRPPVTVSAVRFVLPVVAVTETGPSGVLLGTTGMNSGRSGKISVSVTWFKTTVGTSRASSTSKRSRRRAGKRIGRRNDIARLLLPVIDEEGSHPFRRPGRRTDGGIRGPVPGMGLVSPPGGPGT